MQPDTSLLGYAQIMDPEEEFEEEGDAHEDSPAAPSKSPPADIPMETKTNAPSQTKPKQSSTRARDQLARLEVVIAAIQDLLGLTDYHHGKVIYYPGPT